MWDLLLTNAKLATMDPAVGTGYGVIEDAALGVKDGIITYIGKMQGLDAAPATLAHQVIDVSNQWITPGLIDCHTHLVFGGNRAIEWEQRLNGASYEEIARAGGGILSTVNATRQASETELLLSAQKRLADLQRSGVTTVEVKSGYGLTLSDEMKMLRVAKKLGESAQAHIEPTLLGAHALPPEYRDNRAGYLALICDEMIPAVAKQKLATAVDAFCENIGFTPDEVRQVFTAAKAHGLNAKLHAEQLSDQQGAALAASFNALSADHLEYLSENGVEEMAKNATVAVLLPGAFYFLRETKLPPIEQLRARNIPMALATDCNPGSSPISSALLILNMGCTLFHLTPVEALTAMTRHAAQALGLENKIGTLTMGKQADFALWDISSPADLAYALGATPLSKLYYQGHIVSGL